MAGRTWEIATDRARIEMHEHGDAIVVVWAGTVLAKECDAYLGQLALWLRYRVDAVKLIYDLRGLEQFDRETLLKHADFSKAQGNSVSRIAVITEKAAHMAGITAVNLLQRRPLKSFATMDEALAW